ncbi:hypothetical protein F5148DRAFT_190544 [Russula earlei]|uniref:Uncharacterized protein n=1 Tax=Russula earlei TaxID=71964 RepID=A0ACC0U6M6_9AGAM|nr:hypothetical protein F5148DRAFT_190544 [Russula earlei]
MFPPLLFLQDVMEDFLIHSLDYDPPSSPPRSLLPLMLTCRLFYKLLNPTNNPRLYRRIFHRKFDSSALPRRFPPSSLLASLFYPELKRRFHALRCISRGDVHHPRLQHALLVAYVMVLEHDALNYHHLQSAGLPALLEKYVAERLHRGHNLWPIEDTCNTLAVALFWHMTSQGALDGESIDSRDKIMDILFPLTFAWFRYSFGEQGFDPYLLVNGTNFTPHLSPRACSPLSPAPVTVPVDYMGHAFHLRLPPIALSASLAYFARLDAFPLAYPPEIPLLRVQDGGQGQTVEDIEHYNRSFRTRTVHRGPDSPSTCADSPSTRHDWDWLCAVVGDPFTSGSLRRYTPGTLTGTWRGTYLAPYDRDFTPFMTGEAGPAALPGHSRLPFSCCLEEHLQHSGPKSCPSGDIWDDPSLVPLLPPTTWTRREDGSELFDARSSTKVFYETFNRERPGEEPENVQGDFESGASSTSADQEIVDVILSGYTDVPLQPAWGSYEFSGRVQLTDGLVVLVGQPLNEHGGRLPRRTLYAGYLLSSQNLVGKWKYCSPGAQWEGIWSLCKEE